jgi:hypothetical protein
LGVQAGQWLACLHNILQWRAGAHINLHLACAMGVGLHLSTPWWYGLSAKLQLTRAHISMAVGMEVGYEFLLGVGRMIWGCIKFCLRKNMIMHL